MEQERTFTQEQAQIMYRALFILSEGFFTTESQGYARDTLDHMHELDSAPEADASESKRYVVSWMSTWAGNAWYVNNTANNGIHSAFYETREQAKAEADRLNAASEVQG
jgi:hypothetical protein